MFSDHKHGFLLFLWCLKSEKQHIHMPTHRFSCIKPIFRVAVYSLPEELQKALSSLRPPQLESEYQVSPQLGNWLLMDLRKDFLSPRHLILFYLVKCSTHCCLPLFFFSFLSFNLFLFINTPLLSSQNRFVFGLPQDLTPHLCFCAFAGQLALLKEAPAEPQNAWVCVRKGANVLRPHRNYISLLS